MPSVSQHSPLEIDIVSTHWYAQEQMLNLFVGTGYAENVQTGRQFQVLVHFTLTSSYMACFINNLSHF